MILSPNATDPAQQRESDRRCYLEYTRAAEKLQSFARHYAALAAEVTTDADLSTFAQGYAAEVRRRYEGLAAVSAEQADVAAQTAATYRAHLGLVEDVA